MEAPAEAAAWAAADEGAADHDAALLAGGHFAYELVTEGSGVDFTKNLLGALAHGGGDGEVGPEGGAREEAGEDGVKAGGREGLAAGQLGGDDAEALFELGEIPAGSAEEADAGVRLNQGVELAGEGFEEGGFAAAVGAQDGEVFAGVEDEVDVVQDGRGATGYVDVGEIDDGLRHVALRIAAS